MEEFQPNEKSKHVRETRQGISWMTEDNILCSKYFPNGPAKLSSEEEKESLEYAYQLKDKYGKLLILIHIDNSPPSDKSGRDEGAVLLEELTHAMALVGSKPLSRLAAKMFFGLKPASYPVRIFKDHQEAIEWLREQRD